MKKFFKWIAIVFIGLLILGLILDSSKSPEEKAAEAQAQAERAKQKEENDAAQAKAEADNLPNYTPSDLTKAYEANTVAADEKFKGKKFKVTGVINDIRTDFMDNPYLVLNASGNPFMLPQFSFNKSSKSQLANLQKGNQVTLICTGKGDVAKTPMSGDCTLLSTK